MSIYNLVRDSVSYGVRESAEIIVICLLTLFIIQMEMLWILFLCSILSISKSDQIVYNDAEITTTISNHIPERKRLSIFPKNNIKFIVKPHALNTDNIKESNGETEGTGTRKPLMVKMVPMVLKSRKTSLKTTETVTRKPLMKLRTYTVKTSLNVKDDGETHREDRQRKSSIKTDKARHSKSRMENEELNKLNSTAIGGNNISTDFLYPPEISIGKFSNEEELDRHEFIFLEKKNEDIVINDLLFVSKEDFETSTLTLVETKPRRKRSGNIIEEENMGTTVSPLKYTGRDTRLTNDLHFKNINH